MLQLHVLDSSNSKSCNLYQQDTFTKSLKKLCALRFFKTSHLVEGMQLHATQINIVLVTYA